MIRPATERERAMFHTIRDAFAMGAMPGYIDAGHFDGETRRPGYVLTTHSMKGYGGFWTYREPDDVIERARFWFHSDYCKQYDPEAHIAKLLAAEYALALAEKPKP